MNIQTADRATLNCKFLTNSGGSHIDGYNDQLSAIMIGSNIDIVAWIICRTAAYISWTYPFSELTQGITVQKDMSAVSHQITAVVRRFIDPPPEICAHLRIHAIAHFLGYLHAIGHGGLSVGEVMFSHPYAFTVIERVGMGSQSSPINMASQNRKMVNCCSVIDNRIRHLVIEVKRFWHNYRFTNCSSIVFDKGQDLAGSPMRPRLKIRFVLNRYIIQFNGIRCLFQPVGVISVMRRL